MVSFRVRVANKATSADINTLLEPREYVRGDYRYFLSAATASELSVEDRAVIWRLLDGNMRALYTPSSMGWHPPEKREEIFDQRTRFILVRDAQEGNIVAFSSFRFEREEGEDLLYCYELQVTSAARRRELGQTLMARLEAIASRYSMQKIMLTVLKANVLAAAFYKRIRFTVDPASPTYPDDDGKVDESVDCDYDILSKIIKSKQSESDFKE